MTIPQTQTELSATSYTVSGVKPEHVGLLWHLIVDDIDAALEVGRCAESSDDVRGQIERRECMLWIVCLNDEYVACLVIRSQPERSCLWVWLTGGKDIREWRDTVQPMLVRYAQDQGFRYVEACVRPGLARVLRPAGWRPLYTTVSLEIPQ